MIELSDRQMADFFHRCYSAVDGLWFMKVEEKLGFDTALVIDDEVWRVFPKMQARVLKTIADMGDGMRALLECITTKLALEGYLFEVEEHGGDRGFRVIINSCPWHDKMVSSAREKLSARIGSTVCNSEYATWASEFGGNIGAEQQCRICEGSESCIIQFSEQS